MLTTQEMIMTKVKKGPFEAQTFKTETVRFSEILKVESKVDSKGRHFLKLFGKRDQGRPVSAFAFGKAVHDFKAVKAGDALTATIARSRAYNRNFVKLIKKQPCRQMALALAV